MKISNTRHTSKSASPKRTGRSSSSSDRFQVSSNQSMASGGHIHGVSKIAGVDAILSIQNIENDTDERAKAVTHGHAVLDVLDDLKIGVLTGRITAAKLKKLKKMAERRPEIMEDRHLNSILDHIELRAMVELAKLGQI